MNQNSDYHTGRTIFWERKGSCRLPPKRSPVTAFPQVFAYTEVHDESHDDDQHAQTDKGPGADVGPGLFGKLKDGQCGDDQGKARAGIGK